VSRFPARPVTLIVGLALGVALGLLYTWVIEPVELVNTYPALLRTDYRQGWVRLVALSYIADGNLDRARARLEGLEQEDVAGAIGALIEEYAAAGRPADTLRSLTGLAEALDVRTPAMLVYLYTPAPSPPVLAHTPLSAPTPTPVHTSVPPTPSPPAVPAPDPTHTPTSQPGSASPSPTLASAPGSTPLPSPTPSLLSRLYLARQEQVCQPGQTPHIEVVVRDERGAGLPGVEVWLVWTGGADRAVTGLKPRNGTGYADFNAEPGVRYALSVGELGRPLVAGLQIEACPAQGSEAPAPGSWRLVVEPRPL